MSWGTGLHKKHGGEGINRARFRPSSESLSGAGEMSTTTTSSLSSLSFLMPSRSCFIMYRPVPSAIPLPGPPVDTSLEYDSIHAACTTKSFYKVAMQLMILHQPGGRLSKANIPLPGRQHQCCTRTHMCTV